MRLQPGHFIVIIFILVGFLSALSISEAPVHNAVSVSSTNTAKKPPPQGSVKQILQSENGVQIYQGMCLDCHGDAGQGLTPLWRNTFPQEMRNCWDSGCHGIDHASNTFTLPVVGAPALVGEGALPRFSNAFMLHQYIHDNMPYFPAGSLTMESSWNLTAHLLDWNGKLPENFTLNSTNAAAISTRYLVTPAKSYAPGILLLTIVLCMMAVFLNELGKLDPLSAPKRKPDFIAHLHPAHIPLAQAKFRYTLGAGGLSIFFSLILLLTGLLEMYYYIPVPDLAAISVETITTIVPLGFLVRNLHYWSGQFLLISMTIHVLRVVMTGAYSSPRRLNFLIGLGLLVTILLMNFTGYALRWDEGVHWALVVGVNLLKSIPMMGGGVYDFIVGGGEPGPSTLTRFYTWHIFGLTLVAFILSIWHVFRVRRDGGIAASKVLTENGRNTITRYELLRREILAMTIAGALLLAFSAIVPAPIDQPISEISSYSGDSQAPWFFIWVQQLLQLGDPFIWGVLVPILIVMILVGVPYFLPSAGENEVGSWLPRGNRIAQVLVLSIFTIILALTILGVVKWVVLLSPV